MLILKQLSTVFWYQMHPKIDAKCQMHELTRLLSALSYTVGGWYGIAWHGMAWLHWMHMSRMGNVHSTYVQRVQCIHVHVCYKFQHCTNKRNFGFCGSCDLIFSFEFHFIKLHTHTHTHESMYWSDGRSMSYGLKLKVCFVCIMGRAAVRDMSSDTISEM